MSQDGEFEWYKIVWVHLAVDEIVRPGTNENCYPVFRRLSNERTLVTTSTGIAHDGMTTGSNEVVQFRKLYDERIPVVFIKRSFFQVVLNECRFEW